MEESQTTTPRPLQVGDRVVFKRDICFDYTTYKKGTIGEVEIIDKHGLIGVRAIDSESGGLKFNYICDYNLEPYDRKREFLTRLQSLLREFDASIVGGQDEYSHDDFVKISFNDEKCEIIYQNGDVATFASINPDNIMNYEKE